MRFLLAAMAVAPLALTACGGQGNHHDNGSSSAQARPAAAASPTPSPTDSLSRAAQEARAARAAAAPSGDPAHPTNTTIPGPGDYGFGKIAATAANGEVVAYAPRLERGKFVVPLTMHNTSDKRIAYTVTVTVVGGGHKSPLAVIEKADNVWPGSTWPTEADITASDTDNKSTNGLKISLKVVRDIYPFGDSR